MAVLQGNQIRQARVLRANDSVEGAFVLSRFGGHRGFWRTHFLSVRVLSRNFEVRLLSSTSFDEIDCQLG